MTSPRTPSPATPTAQGTATRRDPLLDNVRFLLVTLVVIGHFLANMRDNELIRFTYTWIYTFHMPAFVFISGLVIHSSALTASGGRKLVAGLLAPLLIFTVLYNIFGRFVDMPTPSDEETLLDPYWLLWFLAALALWRIMVPLVASLRWPFWTTLVLATGFAVALDLTPVLSVDRFVVLMPFFVAGLVIRPDQADLVRTRGWRLIGLLLVALSLPAALWARTLPSGYITFDDGVKGIGGLPAFLGMYLIAAAMTLALLALGPGGRSWMTVWGTRTIYIYLLHGFFVRAFRATELDQTLNTTWGLALTIVVGTLLSIGLGSDPVVRLTHRLVQPSLRWVFGTEPIPALSGGRPTGPGAPPRAAGAV